ncbi:MAG: toll/interleukin-1 receptor domain-containing protein [Myxococcales bacterium]|nr:toll/interleukin-1 receptor domain-containing protein [Myxococcales bacterium]MDH5307146.1 toll/interleukin-1 receptor domain-containing protein [Myxococcales bacterium]MDH5566446.1 toll/interleukin-1 receptor domain-containing protein [Myxococcales bacterium]
MFESERLGIGSAAEKIRVFVSYDREHDTDLHDLLVQQASKAASGFEISARSRARSAADLWEEGLRRRIREVDEVIIICGEHTGGSESVSTELRIAQEEKRPYFLLWGRREVMCTKPTTAKPADGMYSWTSEILQNQILTMRRAARSNQHLAELSRPKAAADSRAERSR